MLKWRGGVGSGGRLTKATTTMTVAAALCAALLSAFGNPSCSHHASVNGHASATHVGASPDAAAHPHGHGHSDPATPNQGKHDTHPCNCPTTCQQAGVLATIEPADGILFVAEFFPASLIPPSDAAAHPDDPAFLHPFANAPPRT